MNEYVNHEMNHHYCRKNVMKDQVGNLSYYTFSPNIKQGRVKTQIADKISIQRSNNTNTFIRLWSNKLLCELPLFRTLNIKIFRCV